MNVASITMAIDYGGGSEIEESQRFCGGVAIDLSLSPGKYLVKGQSVL